MSTKNFSDSRQFNRRSWLQSAAFGPVGLSMSGWFRNLASAGAANPKRRRACILLWMSGGPSQIDTFDPKPGHENGGPFKAIDTSVPGIQISEHLPGIAKQMEHLVPIRSMKTKEGDHQRATYLLRTGYLPQGPIHYPTLGSILSRELGSDEAELPNFISVAPYRFLSPDAFGPGFLGPKYSPLIVGGQNRIIADAQDYSESLRVRNLELPDEIERLQADSRLSLLAGLEHDFLRDRPGVNGASHRAAYQAAVRMMRSEGVKAFSLDDEPDELSDRYGRNQFGQGCLLARRLIERGVPFVEVSLNGVQGNQGIGWDTHQNNFESTQRLCEVLDPAWSTLIADLKDRGLLDSTLIVWMGEFGRTPKINDNTGRDHWPGSWSTVLAGGGVQGGQVYGKTSDDGMTVDDNPVNVPNLYATICTALGLDHTRQNMSNIGRPIPLSDHDSMPVEDVLSG